MEAADVLARCPLFAQLNDDHLTALASISTWRSFDAEAMLFYTGDSPEGLHIVTSGQVRIFIVSPETGRELVLTVDAPYRTVAELPSFDGEPYPANAQVVGPTETLFLDQDQLESLLSERPGLAHHLLRTVGRRLRTLVGLVERLSFQEVIHRLAAYLAEKLEAGQPFELETNAAIAAQLGTVPELVSRNLSRLQQSGVIEMKGRTIVAVDRSELMQMAKRAGR